jgi:DNA topoisomerase III
MELIIAEKPSVAKDIAEALGGFTRRDGHYERADAIISSAIGHLLQLAVPEGEDKGNSLHALPCIPSQFEVKPVEKTADHLDGLVKLIKRREVKTLVNACDAGREGELIFGFIAEYSGTKKPVKRMWLQSMTHDAIRKEHAELKSDERFARLLDAARCRAEADWLVGINSTRGLSKLSEIMKGVRDLVSAGRVQTPVLTLVVDRENARRTFKPVSFWNIVATFDAAAGEYQGVWINPEFKPGEDDNARADRVFQEAAAAAIALECKHAQVTDVQDQASEVKRNPPALFDLTALQREANTKLGFSAKQTLELAQALYEKHKVLSYPRTGSTALPEDYLPTVQAVFGVLAGMDHPVAPHAEKAIAEGYLQLDKRIFNNAKIDDHFAIVPTGTVPASLSGDEQKLFSLVVQRFVSAFYPTARFNKTVRTTRLGQHAFQSTGNVLVDAGWLAVTGKDADDNDSELTTIQQGEKPPVTGVDAKEGKTKAPPRFTEATLLAAMENAGRLVDDDDAREAMKGCGLGTPATRAAIIEGLLADTDAKRNPKEPFLVREKQALVPTSKGDNTIAFLRTNGVEQLCSPGMTGEWERRLALVEKGQESREHFMSDIKDMTTQIIDTIRKKAKTLPQYSAALLKARCPACGGEVRPDGIVYSCGSCTFRVNATIAKRKMSREEVETIVSGEKTEVLDGFISAKEKPFKAHLVYNAAEKKVVFEFPPPEDSGFACPKCSSPLIHRQKAAAGKKKGYNFWGCSGYPACSVSLNDKGGAPDYASNGKE